MPLAQILLGWVFGKSADAVSSHLRDNRKLQTSLDNAISKWADSLPNDCYVHPQALFPADTSDPALTDRPHLHTLRAMLANNEWPSPADWQSAFIETWRYVRQTVTEPQPFFSLTEDEVLPHLMKLADATFAVCKKYEPAFRSLVVDTLKGIDDKVHGIDINTTTPFSLKNFRRLADIFFQNLLF